MLSMSEMFYGDHEESTYMRSSYVVNSEFSSGPQTTYMLPVIELKVPMCCPKCEEKVEEALLEVDGVYGVVCDQLTQKVIVTGNANPEKVLKRAKRFKKQSDIWTRSSHDMYSSRIASSQGHAHPHSNISYRGSTSHRNYCPPSFSQNPSYGERPYSQYNTVPSYRDSSYPSYNQSWCGDNY